MDFFDVKKDGYFETDDGKIMSWYNNLNWNIITDDTKTCHVQVFLDHQIGNNYVRRYRQRLDDDMETLYYCIRTLETCDDFTQIENITHALKTLIKTWNSFCTDWTNKAEMTADKAKRLYEFAIDNLRYNEVADGKGDAIYLRNCNRNSE